MGNSLYWNKIIGKGILKYLGAQWMSSRIQTQLEQLIFFYLNIPNYICLWGGKVLTLLDVRRLLEKVSENNEIEWGKMTWSSLRTSWGEREERTEGEVGLVCKN